MDYEKKYRDLVEAVKELQEANPSDKGIQKWIKDNIPELKESEDERVRKKVIDVLKLNVRGAESQMQASRGVDRTFEVHACNKVIACLEKQGEKKPNPYSGTSFEYNGHTWGMCARDGGVEILIDGHLKGRVFTNDSNAKEMFIKALERVEEQNAKGYKLTDCDKNSWWEDFKAYVSCAIEQNPAWSEEDDNFLINAINVCEINDYNETAEWLKDLKERVQPQPKQEWSEEDETGLTNIIIMLKEGASLHFGKKDITKAIDKLKSLKFRLLSPLIREFDKEEGSIIDHLIAICDDAMCYDTFAGCSKKDIEKYKTFLTNLKFGINPQPQTTWKPSDEQMKVLDVAIKSSHLTTAEYNGLVKLREQLKKL